MHADSIFGKESSKQNDLDSGRIETLDTWTESWKVTKEKSSLGNK